ncbi:RIP metalloprotease RseP [Litorisediminicola beolgyonensis]|uniref:Zinc metalloprotease n=1 Tax=Litorisediminicola beolgyonensis TaxID=1173614 RepID=A0ABW3ZFJ9_9RHOB
MDMVSLIPQFGGFLWTVLAFVVALSVIVAVHEYGHYIVGRWSGIHAEVFSLGFGPVLFSRTDKHGTVWQFALLPFGGFVKFKGDANASGGADETVMDALSESEARRTMNGAPLWARALTVAAGPVFNFILSFFVFAGIFMLQGQTSDPLTVGELRALPVEQPLEEGDVILSIGGIEPTSVNNPDVRGYFPTPVPLEPRLDYVVLRDGEEQSFTGPYPFPPLITNVVPRSAASDAGLEPGDAILAIDGQDIFAFSQLRDAVEGSEGAALPLEIWRGGETLDLSLQPKRTDEPQPDGSYRTVYRIGVTGGIYFDPATEFPGVLASMTGAVSQTWAIITGSLSAMGHIITGAISTCNLSGPIGIAETSADMASQGTQSFIWFIAVLSTAVGLLNLFPVPVLDGGHLCFFAYEAVAGRKPSDRALKFLMTVGLTLVLGLMIFSLSNDIFCP